MQVQSFKNILFLIILFSGIIAKAQVKFEVSIDKKIVGVDEVFEVRFLTDLDSAKFNAPKFENFIIMNKGVSIRDLSDQPQNIYKKAYVFRVVPKKAGEFFVEEAQLLYNKNLYKTKGIEIKVIDQSYYNPIPEETIESRFDEGIHIIAEASKKKLNLNDSLVLTYKLYVSEDIAVENFRVDMSPKYYGFKIMNSKSNEFSIKNRIFRKKRCRMVILREIILKPVNTGAFEIQPLRLEIDSKVPIYKKEESMLIKKFERLVKMAKSNSLKILIIE